MSRSSSDTLHEHEHESSELSKYESSDDSKVELRRRRTRTSMACLTCRRRKSKCDGDPGLAKGGNEMYPVDCSNCLKAGNRCSYINVSPEENEKVKARKKHSKAKRNRGRRGARRERPPRIGTRTGNRTRRVVTSTSVTATLATATTTIASTGTEHPVLPIMSTQATQVPMVSIPELTYSLPLLEIDGLAVIHGPQAIPVMDMPTNYASNDQYSFGMWSYSMSQTQTFSMGTEHASHMAPHQTVNPNPLFLPGAYASMSPIVSGLDPAYRNNGFFAAAVAATSVPGMHMGMNVNPIAVDAYGGQPNVHLGATRFEMVKDDEDSFAQYVDFSAGDAAF